MDLFASCDQIQNFLDQNELQIKMFSSLLNDSSKSEEFSLNDIEVVVDNKGQDWFKRVHVGKFLELFHTHRSTTRLAAKDKKNSAFLKAEGGCHNATSPREDDQDHEFVSGDWIQNFFDPKRITNKMSSVMPFTSNAVELCVVTISEKPWTRAKEVCRALEYSKKTADIVKVFCSRKNYAHMWQLTGLVSETKRAQAFTQTRSEHH